MDNYNVILIFKLIDIMIGLRISEEEEYKGADIIYHIIENNEIEECEINNENNIIYTNEECESKKIENEIEQNENKKIEDEIKNKIEQNNNKIIEKN